MGKTSMKKGMKKSMKKGMKKSMKKAKVVSKIAKGKMAKALVFRGKKEKTSGGISASQLIKSKSGKIVSKKMSANSKKRYGRSGPMRASLPASSLASKDSPLLAARRRQGRRCT